LSIGLILDYGFFILRVMMGYGLLFKQPHFHQGVSLLSAFSAGTRSTGADIQNEDECYEERYRL
jgi:hypothetical protein